MSAAQKIRTKVTTVTRHETQELSIKAIELIPESLQVRALLDPDWSIKYSQDMRKGDDFPAILVYRLPTGRLVCADGYHRIDAAKRLGLLSIRAQVCDGTMEEALLAAIKANRAEFHRGRKFDKMTDGVHAAELMIRNETFRGWSNSEISRRSGAVLKSVRKIRLKLEARADIPIPKKVIMFACGVPDGRLRNYSKAKTHLGETPALQNEGPRHGYYASLNGKRLYLGMNPSSATERLERAVTKHESNRAYLTNGLLFRKWLTSPDRRVYSEFTILGGVFVRGFIVAPVHEASQVSALEVIGRLLLIAGHRPEPARLVAVGYFNATRAVDVIKLAARHNPPIEFLTPEEFLERLGVTDADQGAASHDNVGTSVDELNE